jgi:hypothetical protein
LSANRQHGPEAVKRLGPDGMKPIIDDFNSRATSMGLTERIIPEGATTDEILGRLGSNGSKAILDAARLAAETNPSAWADLDLSQDGIDAKVTERMAAERRVNEELLALSPNPGWNNLIGGIAGTVLDPINIAAAIATGGGGSLWRVMMREAIAGAGVEAGRATPARRDGRGTVAARAEPAGEHGPRCGWRGDLRRYP